MNPETPDDEGIGRFPDQALWGERSVFGVAACYTYNDGVHAQINAMVGHVRVPDRERPERQRSFAKKERSSEKCAVICTVDAKVTKEISEVSRVRLRYLEIWVEKHSQCSILLPEFSLLMHVRLISV
jgi:hypothetical protein